MKPNRSLIRRLCLALITARTLAFAVAPLVDLQSLTPVGTQVAVQPAEESDAPSPPGHDPTTCAICALLHDTPWAPGAVAAPHADVVVVGQTFELGSAATPAASRQGFRSRAPPAFG